MATQYEWGATGLISAVLLALLPLNNSSAEEIYRPARTTANNCFATTATSSRGTSVKRRPGRLEGRVSVSEQTTVVGQRIDDLLEAALNRDPGTAVLDQAVEHFQSKPARISAQAKDGADFLFSYRGFGPSSEAGDIITGEKLKLKSRASAEYARQKHIDELHTRIVSSVMQIAMGLGMSDQARGQTTVNIGVNSLRSLVGDDQASETMQMLSGWSKQLIVPDEIFKQPAWDVERRCQMSSAVVKTALARDPVVVEIQKHLHKYNQLSKLARASGRVVETTLGVASRAPVLHHVGTPALVAFVTATGGPEQAKIMKELYLDRRYASRLQVVSDETHQALDNYQVAVLTYNPVLLACSEAIISDMAGHEIVPKLFGTSVLPPGSKFISPITTSTLTANTAPVAYKVQRSVQHPVRQHVRARIGYRGAQGY